MRTQLEQLAANLQQAGHEVLEARRARELPAAVLRDYDHALRAAERRLEDARRQLLNAAQEGGS